VFLSGLDTFTPASLLSNEPTTYTVNEEEWEPKNFKPVPEPDVSMRRALTESINIPTVHFAMQIGVDRIVRTARAFHFSTPLRPYPALALGAFETIPLELARAYCAFAADGVLPYPLSLKEVVGENGAVLERRHMTIEHVTSRAEAFIMTSMLQSVVTEGTARSLEQMGIEFPTAGKTGTSNNSRDAWYVGYTPDILALVWVGFDNEESIHATGSVAALPIWADLMNAIPQHVSGNWFRTPEGVVRKRVCTESGQLAVLFGCPKTRREFFLENNVPVNSCPLHGRGDAMIQMLDEGKDIIEKP
jgi:penicillin-binding protein 1B